MDLTEISARLLYSPGLSRYREKHEFTASGNGPGRFVRFLFDGVRGNGSC